MLTRLLTISITTAVILVGCGGGNTKTSNEVSSMPHQIDIKPKTSREFDPLGEEYLHYMKTHNLNSVIFNIKDGITKLNDFEHRDRGLKYVFYYDSDHDKNTGYYDAWVSKVGADYLYENDVLYKYTGRPGSHEWSWEVVDFGTPQEHPNHFHGLNNALGYGLSLNSNWTQHSFLGYFDTSTPYVERKFSPQEDTHKVITTTEDQENIYLHIYDKNYQKRDIDEKYYNYTFSINNTNYSIQGNILFNEDGEVLNDNLLYETREYDIITIIPKASLSQGSINLKSLESRTLDWTLKEKITFASENISQPYQRVAVIPGTVDDINSIALKIADYVVHTDEAETLGFPSNWVVAGANPEAGEEYEGLKNILGIPVDTGHGVYKSRVIEFCNGPYAGQAVGTGQQRASSLPCEVAVHSDGENVYIDMLNTETIFKLFFPNTPDPDGELEGMAKAVNSQIRTMILTSLANTNNLNQSNKELGPKLTNAELNDIEDSDIYLVTKYKSTTGATFTTEDAKSLSTTIIAMLGSDEATADTHVEGLSENSQWRSARKKPLAIPGAFVAEACSPAYAQMATKLGTEYITALPCEISAYLDRTDETNKTLSISILRPGYIFKYMFKNAVEKALASGKITNEEAEQFDALVIAIADDLNKIVDKALAESGLNLTKI